MLLWMAAGQAPAPAVEGPAVVEALRAVPPHEHEQTLPPTVDPGEIDEVKRWISALEARVAEAERGQQAATRQRDQLLAAQQAEAADDEARRLRADERERALVQLAAAAQEAAIVEGLMARGEKALGEEVAAVMDTLRTVATTPDALSPTVQDLVVGAHDEVVLASERLDNSDLFNARGHLTRAVALVQAAVSTARTE